VEILTNKEPPPARQKKKGYVSNPMLKTMKVAMVVGKVWIQQKWLTLGWLEGYRRRKEI
jgi:hypothetical protein